MAGVNRAIIVGNLGQNPEVRKTQNGVKVVTMSVATSESWKDKNTGEKKEKTEWHRVIIWGGQEGDGLAGVAEQYLKKGSKVYVEGKMQTRKWTDDKGVERWTTEVVLQGFGANLVLLDGKGEGGGNRPPPPDSPDDYGRASSRPGAERAGQDGSVDDNIPF
jgi:single-strand DNA-binding protein